MTQPERALVGAQHPLVDPLSDMVEPPLAPLMSRPEQPGAEHRGQRQRDEHRHQDRHGDRDGELAEQPADESAEEAAAG